MSYHAMGLDLNSLLNKSISSSLDELKGTAMSELTKQLYNTPEVQQHLQEQLKEQSVKASGSFLYDYKHIIIPLAVGVGLFSFYGLIQAVKR